MMKRSETTHETAYDEMLREASLNVMSRSIEGQAQVLALGSSEYPGMQIVLAETPDRGGATLGIRVELGSSSELMGKPLDSEQALAVMGALMSGLQSQGLEVSLLTGQKGLEAVMLSVHFCPGQVSATQLKSKLTQLQRVAQALPKAFEQKGPELLQSIQQASRMYTAAPVESKRANVMVAPTFDEVERDRLKQRMQQYQQTHQKK